MISTLTTSLIVDLKVMIVSILIRTRLCGAWDGSRLLARLGTAQIRPLIIIRGRVGGIIDEPLLTIAHHDDTVSTAS